MLLFSTQQIDLDVDAAIRQDWIQNITPCISDRKCFVYVVQYEESDTKVALVLHNCSEEKKGEYYNFIIILHCYYFSKLQSNVSCTNN